MLVQRRVTIKAFPCMQGKEASGKLFVFLFNRLYPIKSHKYTDIDKGIDNT